MRIVIPILLIFLLSACSGKVPTDAIIFTRENLNTDISPFIENGCKQIEQYGRIQVECTDSNREELTICRRCYKKDGVGGFSVPVLECHYCGNTENVTESDYVRNIGVDHFAGIQYIIFKNNNFKYIKNKDMLKSFVSTIDTPIKAISYVIAYTGSSPKFEMVEEEWGSHRFAPGIVDRNAVDSYVLAKDNGFIVRLYDTTGGACCGTDYILYAIDYFVTHDGIISEDSRTKIGKIDNRAIA